MHAQNIMQHIYIRIGYGALS